MTEAGIGGDRAPARIPADLRERAGRLAWAVLREPFRRRPWVELAFFVAGSGLAVGAALVLGVLVVTGTAFTVVFAGVVLIAAALRAARGVGRWQRVLARRLLGEEIAEPEPFGRRPGRLGWLRAVLADRAAWRSLVYVVGRVPLTVFGVWFALSVWLAALSGVISPVTGGFGAVSFGVLGHAMRTGLIAGGPVTGPSGPVVVVAHAGDFVTGVLLLFVAPWMTRLVVHLDRQMMHLLLGPDAVSSRVQRLEESRSRTLDAAAVTLKRIERNLHDGTQAQLVAVAMRLGQAKEKLARLDATPDGAAGLDAVRRLVDEAHRGAKEAISDLRDLARGIHPPALDTGLANALSTLAARSPVPTEVRVSVPARPTPAIEAICYFCAAELLANVHQHAHATRASLSCAQHGPWIRLVVRDDGRGGAAANRLGSSSSGLAGLADRVRAVDGNMSIASPAGGPTAVTVDLPSSA